jgi:hypothetical protein
VASESFFYFYSGGELWGRRRRLTCGGAAAHKKAAVAAFAIATGGAEVWWSWNSLGMAVMGTVVATLASWSLLVSLSLKASVRYCQPYWSLLGICKNVPFSGKTCDSRD